MFMPGGTEIMYRVNTGGPFFEWWIHDLETGQETQVEVPSRSILHIWMHPAGDSVVFIDIGDVEQDVWLLEIEEGGR